MNNLLQIEHLSKHYKNFSVNDVSLSVPAGSVVGFIGSNGAGKTTTIKAALGLIKIDGGTISLFGKPLHTASSKEYVQLKKRIGVVFDALSFPETMRVGDVADVMRHAYNEWNGALFTDYVARFALNKNQKIKELSRGMGMKLSLACALSHNAQLLILDEATAGLDPLARDEALEYLRQFVADENRGILISSHITSDLEKIADYIVCIEEGRIIFSIETNTITDLAGIAHCRMSEFEEICTSGFFQPGEMRYSRRSYEVTLLVPDRFAFAEAFKKVALDKASIDSYMALMLKGEVA